MFFSRRAGSKFVDRGDPDNYDFQTGDFSKDGNPHDLDISAIIPKGTVSALLRIILETTVAGQSILFRTKGNTVWANCCKCFTAIANTSIAYDIMVTPNSDGVIEYQTSVAVFNTLNITVGGWLV